MTALFAFGLLAAVACIGGAAGQNPACTFTQCDYGKGDRTMLPAAT